MKFLRALLLAACLFFGGTHLEAANKHQKAVKSVFILYGHSDQRNVDAKALCTAFAYQKVADGYILMTAGHCISSGAPPDATYFVSEGQIVDHPKDRQSVEVLNHVDDGKMDVCELHLKTARQYPLLELDKREPKLDDKVFYVGYPEMVSEAVLTGRVSSVGVIEVTPYGCDICKGRITVQISGAGGASGSPIVNERTGKVIAVLEGHIYEGGVVAVPVSAINKYYAVNGHSKKRTERGGRTMTPTSILLQVIFQLLTQAAFVAAGGFLFGLGFQLAKRVVK